MTPQLNTNHSLFSFQALEQRNREKQVRNNMKFDGLANLFKKFKVGGKCIAPTLSLVRKIQMANRRQKQIDFYLNQVEANLY